jgi:hypothetical protein
MPETTIDRLRPGMVLARDAVHVNGRVLLEAGTTLATNHLRMLKAWGVHTVTVDGAATDPAVDEPPDAVADPDRCQAAREALAPRFRHADLAHPVIAELFRFCLRKSL